MMSELGRKTSLQSFRQRFIERVETPSSGIEMFTGNAPARIELSRMAVKAEFPSFDRRRIIQTADILGRRKVK
jgi:aminoglycoside/choline kinase family phosphotransferase